MRQRQGKLSSTLAGFRKELLPGLPAGSPARRATGQRKQCLQGAPDTNTCCKLSQPSSGQQCSPDSGRQSRGTSTVSCRASLFNFQKLYGIEYNGEVIMSIENSIVSRGTYGPTIQSLLIGDIGHWGHS